MSHPPLRVLIVGASIAGPTTAYWLAKSNAIITIIERFPSLRRGGQNVDIRTSGVTVMRRMGRMEADVKSLVPKWDGMQLMSSKGKPMFTITSTGDPDSQSLMSEYEIFRGDLGKVLYDLTMSEDAGRVRYVFGEQVESISQKGGGESWGPNVVRVEFKNGKLESQEFDLVIAADGATSRTRAMGLECGLGEYVVPVNAWAAYFSTQDDVLEGSKMCRAASCVGGRWYGVAQCPGVGNRVVMMGIHPRNQRAATEPFREALRKGEAAVKSFVADSFASHTVGAWKSGEVLQALGKSDDFYAHEIVQVKPPSLYHRRFVLVGDAGYATGPTGQGTSLAMTGAYVLAGEIHRHPGDVEAALKAYEERMKPIIEDMQMIPPGMPGLLAPQTEWGMWLRNVVMVSVVTMMEYGQYFSWLGGVGKMLGTAFGSAFGGDRHDLPLYFGEE